VLLTGGGSKAGAELTKNLADNGHNVTVLTHSNFSYPGVTTVPVDWNTIGVNNFFKANSYTKYKYWLNKKYDLIFFNHNAGDNLCSNMTKTINNRGKLQGEAEAQAQKDFVSTFVPFMIIKILEPTFTENTKIGFVSSGIVSDDKENLANLWLYKTRKYSWLTQMKAFSYCSKGIFFAIQPYSFTDNVAQEVDEIRRTIEFITPEHNGMYVGRDFVDKPWAVYSITLE